MGFVSWGFWDWAGLGWMGEMGVGSLQVGVETSTWMTTTGGGLTMLPALGMKPESKPWMVVQGTPKADCVTVWLVDMKVNCTRSPTAALMVLGV